MRLIRESGFKTVIVDLLESENDPAIKTAIIQKIVHKIIVKNEGVEIFFYIGERHYKRELAIAGSQLTALNGGGCVDGTDNGRIRKVAATRQSDGTGSLPEKRRTSPLPVFHGNLETAQILNLGVKKPLNYFYDTGSNSLNIGSERRT